MDSNSINMIIVKEIEAIKKLLILMEEQHGFLIKNDVFKLEDIVERIEVCNREIAEVEMKRRKIINGQSMKAVIADLNNDELDKNYRLIQKLLSELKVQKESNEVLIKMGLGFSTKMLSILNPDRKAKTYNSYGRLRR